MKMMASIVVVVAAVCATPVPGQTLYRCKDAEGISSYQQTPCPKAVEDAGTVPYTPQPDSPHWQEAPERGALPDEQRHAAEQTISPQPSTGRRPASISPMSDDAEQMRRLEHMARTPEGRAMLRATRGEPSPAERRAAARPPQEPSQVFDQFGNSYTNPPGSPVVIDNRTGRTCRKEGIELVCE